MAPRAGLFVCPGCERVTPLGGRCGSVACGGADRHVDSGRHAGSGALVPFLDGLAAMAPYGERALQRLLHEYKYSRAEEAGAALRVVFSAAVAARLPAFHECTKDALIVPIPLVPLKLATRGFNQSEMFARELGRLCSRPVVPRLLSRVSGGAAQATMDDASARATNAAGKFAVRLPFPPGRKFVLVDDVATTRATLNDAARALKVAGASEVRAVTVLLEQ